MGSQDNLLMSVEAWDELIGPRLKRWCDLAHRHGVKAFYHSDGAVEPLVERLVGAGIDVFNPIQHCCPGMDMAALKKNYGSRVVFHGAVDNQHVLPFGTADEVRAETADCLASLASDGGGYICCSCHNMQAGTPVENILAMIETVHSTPVTR
jgi:uroporphyrinogen decarboxylase